MSMIYPKMQTLWKRQPEHPHLIMEGKYSRPEFANIRRWSITEKIDGMGLRTIFKKSDTASDVTFRGRTDNAQIPKKLMAVLTDKFNHDNLRAQFLDAREVILFCEGYGAKIQKGGGLYRPDNGFILFDVVVDGIWCDRESVKEIADAFDIECVPVLGVMDEAEAVEYVKSKPQSLISEQQKIAEGIVARSDPLMRFQDCHPIMWKLKVRDFEEAKPK